ncbi:MAG: UDP-N-acetylglucosamine--N-acetylmuramyl-(pentapeptide) pyrophosphoryl-undecaprenol N-acetylglucosamine transferase [Patescibacteria group bacterium]
MKLVCVGGGTLGSVTPLIAVAEVWQKSEPSLRIEWWGTKAGPEKNLIKFKGWKFVAIPAGKFRRYWSWRNLTDLFSIGRGFFAALWRFGLKRPDFVMSAGGFVAVPVGWAAWCYRVPQLIHQADVRSGLANKLLTPAANLITVAWPIAVANFPARKTVLTGNPVRPGFADLPNQAAARIKLGLKPDWPTLLIMGGGTGAVYINGLISRTIKQLTEFSQVIHLTGLHKGEERERENYLSVPLSNDMITLIAASDLAVTRGGMGAISELAAASKPTIVIPIPDTHQEDNAAWLKQNQAAAVLPQNSLTAEMFVDTLRQLLLSEAAVTLGSNLHKLLNNDAAEKIVAQIIGLLQRNKAR